MSKDKAVKKVYTNDNNYSSYTCIDIGYIKNTDTYKIFAALIKYKNIDGIVATFDLSLYENCIPQFSDLLYDIKPLLSIKIGKSIIKSDEYTQDNPLFMNSKAKYQVIYPIDKKNITCKVVFLNECHRNKKSKL